MKINLYLAHSIHEMGLGKGIQQTLEIRGFNVINPFSSQTEHPIFKAVESGNNKKFQWTSYVDIGGCDDIVFQDLAIIANSHVILLLFPSEITVGIPCEMMYGWMNHKNMYAVVPDTLQYHPWIKSLTNDHVYTRYNEAIDRITSDFEYLLSH